jgi:hypothetical protein
LWLIDPLLGRDLETNNEYGRCCAIGESIKRPFLGISLVNTPTKIEELLKAVFSVGSAARLYNEDPRPAERMIERELIVGSWHTRMSVGVEFS